MPFGRSLWMEPKVSCVAKASLTQADQSPFPWAPKRLDESSTLLESQSTKEAHHQGKDTRLK